MDQREVALAAAPFLVEASVEVSGATRAALVRLLSDLACAGSPEHSVTA